MDLIRVDEESIDLQQLVNAVKTPSAGAVTTFLGCTRDSFQGKAVVSLSYEAYPEMAVRQLQRICSETRYVCVCT